MENIFIGTGACEKCGNWNEVVYEFPGAHPLAAQIIERMSNPAPYASDSAAYILIKENGVESAIIETGRECMKCGCNSCGNK